MMYREKIEALKNWKIAEGRKPLIVSGARQVGKTWLAKEFGQTEYQKVAYISFDNNSRMQNLFTEDFSVDRLVQGFKAETNVDIEIQNTLIILDEIQEVPKALTALKYFYEHAPEYHIIVAGSLLGVATHAGASFPVGKIDYLELSPLTFREFLLAQNEPQLVKLIDDLTDFKLLSVFHNKLINHLKTYFFIGGMPEVVANYAHKKSWKEARDIQKKILYTYYEDFSKHVPRNMVPRVRQVWQTIPAQLAKENKKFIYNLIREGARAKEYELALMWLIDAGLIRRLNRIETPRMPVSSYADLNAFKIFHLDIGLLAAMTNLSEKTLLGENDVFVEFKGSLAEQFALQELQNLQNIDICYWANDGQSRAEIEFIIQFADKIIPVEIKSGNNLRSKSLKAYIEKYRPPLAIRSSQADYKKTDNLYDVPLYVLSGFIDKFLGEGDAAELVETNEAR
jgi:predicted AAA+ superfamily ATPase